MPSIHVAFDLYGTLLDTTSVSKKLSEHLPQSVNADAVSTAWRTYQLEYTWRLNSMDVYASFDVVTRKSLKHAVKEAGHDLNDEAIDDVIRSYDQLNVFEDVSDALDALKGIQYVSTQVFSNGTEERLEPLDDLVRPFIVMDEIKRYKPAGEVYRYLAKQAGKEGNLEHVWLISGNPFDVVGARRAGLNAIWVDRKGKGWYDQLGEPTRTVKSLREVASIISEV